MSEYFSTHLSDWASSLAVLLSETNPSPALLALSTSELARMNAGRTIFALPGVVRMLVSERPKVIVSSLPHVSAVVSLAKLLTRSRALHVARVESDFRRTQNNGFAGWFREKLTKALLARADHYIVVAEELGSPTALWLARDKERFTAIPNPVVNPPGLVQGPGVNTPVGPTFGLVAVGRLASEKNFSLAIAMVARLLEKSGVPVTLDIFGEGPLRGPLQEEIFSLGLTGSVRLHGHVHDKDVIYGSGGILVVTSLYEGNPLSIVEALAYGLSVVSVDCDFGPREILIAEWLGSLSRADPEDLGAKVLAASERVQGNDESRRRREYALEKFGLNFIASRHEQLFLSLLEGAGRNNKL